MTILKQSMLNNHIKCPRGIKGLRWQFLKYKLPDEKIAQDIVAAFVVFAGYLSYLGFTGIGETTEERADDVLYYLDRYSRPYSRETEEEYDRSWRR